uniref:FAD-binding PCMH-type domain-containing protein n=1 Tax=Kalanchoe fedtschenkoi TaxID=63787 RepID=A0A7N0T185_KALFE
MILTGTRNGFCYALFFILRVPMAKSDQQCFLQCMSKLISSSSATNDSKTRPESQLIFQASEAFSFLHHSQLPMQNLKFLNYTTPKPLHILTPRHPSEIQSAVLCSKSLGLQIRIRSNGHDYEGLSSLCNSPFIIIDLVNLRSVDIDIGTETAWVQSGATLGELYYSIASKSSVHGFPAGTCPSVGVGGHFSGGGFGTMLRKHGLAADQVVDAYLINARGKLLDRKMMGEELFWAIRGGGGASFGVIVAWKVKLVKVPPKVTVFNVDRTLAQGATSLVHTWQHIASKLPEELLIRIIIQDVESGKDRTVQATFNSLFLGEINQLMPLMRSSFPELGLQEQNCIELSWVESTLFFNGMRGQPLETLLDRTHTDKSFFKAKSDYVHKPIPEYAFEGIWQKFLGEERVFMIMEPYGGRMDQISESQLPFPHRKGNIYNIQYLVKWNQHDVRLSNKHVHWIRGLYRYMTPFVSANPRAAYLNYRDLDLGSGMLSYSQGQSWGIKYFKGNFKRLAQVKSTADPHNFFRNQQSIPPLASYSKRNAK